MSSTGSPLIDGAQALYDHFRKAVDAMPLPPWVKNPEADDSQQADPATVKAATQTFVDAAAKKNAITPTAAATIRQKASR